MFAPSSARCKLFRRLVIRARRHLSAPIVDEGTKQYMAIKYLIARCRQRYSPARHARNIIEKRPFPFIASATRENNRLTCRRSDAPPALPFEYAIAYRGQEHRDARWHRPHQSLPAVFGACLPLSYFNDDILWAISVGMSHVIHDGHAMISAFIVADERRR